MILFRTIIKIDIIVIAENCNTFFSKINLVRFCYFDLKNWEILRIDLISDI